MTVLVIPSWHALAACKHADVNLFFGPDGESELARERRERRVAPICDGCPVRALCLEYSVGRPEHFGTWGGLNEDDRRAERRRRLREARGSYERDNELRRARRQAAKQVAS